MYFKEPQNIGGVQGITPSVKFLLILNVAVFLAEALLLVPFSGLFALPAVWWKALAFGQLFTYMFVHGGSTHLFVNMLGLFFMGPSVERTIGSFRFFLLYYASGILGGLGWSLLAAPESYCVGASGAVMGVLGAFGALYPNARLLLWFIIPVRAWVLVLGLALWELSETISAPKIGGIANAAHLVGGVAGFFYAFALKYPHHLQALNRLLFFMKPAAKPRPIPHRDKPSKKEIDRILAKIGAQGMGALTVRERERLKRATRR